MSKDYVEILPCPICNKKPKIFRDYGYENGGFGAWCIIKCKPLVGKTHLKIECGKSTWERAHMYAIIDWNEYVLSYKESKKGK